MQCTDNEYAATASYNVEPEPPVQGHDAESRLHSTNQ